MDKTICARLQNCFAEISRLCSGSNYDKSLFNEACNELKELRNIISAKRFHDKRLLLYCIDTLLDIIDEGHWNKIAAFARTVEKMPQIALGTCNIYSFDKEITKFQNKYGDSYFPDFKKTKPRFQKKAPKNIWYYFTMESDESFRRMHPVRYYLLCAIGIGLWMLPSYLYVTYMESLETLRSEAWGIIGIVGTCMIGIGLYNIVAAWVHQYLGHVLTAVCFLGGGAITALAILFI